MTNRTSVIELQEQCEYTLDVEIEKGEKITGAFGKTFYKAEWLDREESPVVLIEMKGNKVSQEVFLYISLDHRHIIKTYGLVDPNDYRIDPNSILLLQEYAESGDLGGLLVNRYFIPDQNVLLEIFIQVADAMIFLSNNGIIHGDLACRNVLVFKSHPHDPKRNLVKLIDFGSTQNSSQLSNTKIDIPVRYVAPEILRSDGRSGYSEKSDIYSFGVFMREACSFGEMPYKDINDDNEVCRQKLDGKKLTRPDKCDPNIWKLMNLCWNDRPADRPNFQMIYTQLRSIQNVESPSRRSNSILSSSPIIDENSCLFTVEYKTCQDCNSRYTDYDSHKHTCSEQKLECYKCGRQYRRAISKNHTEKCNGLSNDSIKVSLTPHDSSSEELYQNKNMDQKYSSSIPFSSLSNVDTNDSRRLLSIKERSRLDSSSSQSNRDARVIPKSPSLSSEMSTRPEPAKTPRINAPEKLSQSNTIQLPCEICDKSIDESQFKTHQIQCNKIYEERLEKMRREIEQQETVETIECCYCDRKYSIEELDEHQNTCSSNPENVPDRTSVLTRTLSNSVPDLRNTTIPFEVSASSNQSFDTSKNNHRSKLTVDLKELKPVAETKKPPTNNKKDEPSGFRKFVSRLWPFKKKGTAN